VNSRNICEKGRKVLKKRRQMFVGDDRENAVEILEGGKCGRLLGSARIRSSSGPRKSKRPHGGPQKTEEAQVADDKVGNVLGGGGGWGCTPRKPENKGGGGREMCMSNGQPT